MVTGIKRKRLIALLAPMGVVVGFTLAGSVAASDQTNPYLAGPGKGVVKNSAGECWTTVGGMKQPMTECGDMTDDDGDGVPNDRDKCPDTPKGVKVDADGCPLDSDGDGVPDYMDKCPGTPSGVRVDADGCPLDSDGDGVPDYRDKCPGTPAGAKVDSDGCEIVQSLTINLVKDEFDFDSAVIKPEMEAALSGFAEKVKASKGNETLSITGHTDSTGPEAYNQGLSERRANAVADYLAGRGVDRDRMTTAGAGESQPIADNGTREGRAQNRRVEISTQ